MRNQLQNYKMYATPPQHIVVLQRLLQHQLIFPIWNKYITVKVFFFFLSYCNMEIPVPFAVQSLQDLQDLPSFNIQPCITCVA